MGPFLPTDWMVERDSYPWLHLHLHNVRVASKSQHWSRCMSLKIECSSSYRFTNTSVDPRTIRSIEWYTPALVGTKERSSSDVGLWEISHAFAMIGNVKLVGVCPASIGRRLPTTKRLLQGPVDRAKRWSMNLNLACQGKGMAVQALLTRISQLVVPDVLRSLRLLECRSGPDRMSCSTARSLCL